MSTYRIKGETGDWEVVIGMEVHAQIVSKSKLFSGASTSFGAEPNDQVSFVDAAMPGMLPVINAECIRQAVRTGLALRAQVNPWSRFDRKNYFYADLPQGYQISQFKHPIIGEGCLVLDDHEGKEVEIERIHIEQDAGKSIHDRHPELSYVDLNRAGVALMEIVSKPDLRSPEEAGSYLKKLRLILRTIGTCDGNMEEGSMRADVNVSVRKPGDPLGTRCEIKNVNSVRFVMQAIVFEARRQVEIIEDGGEISQETRLFDSTHGETHPMRSKEDAHDYRYFPDPDLPPLILTDAFIDQCRTSLPELPDERRSRFIDDLALTAYNADVLVAEHENSIYFEKLLAACPIPEGKTRADVAKRASNWVISDLFGELNARDIRIEDCPVSPEHAAELMDLVMRNVISVRLAKDVLELMFSTGDSPAEIVEKHGLKQVTDSGEIEKVIAEVLAANPEQLKAYKGGKDKLFGFFVGQVMKAMKGKANPAAVNDLLKKALSDD